MRGLRGPGHVIDKTWLGAGEGSVVNVLYSNRYLTETAIAIENIAEKRNLDCRLFFPPARRGRSRRGVKILAPTSANMSFAGTPKFGAAKSIS